MIRLLLLVIALVIFVLVALSKILNIDNIVLYPVQWFAAGSVFYAASWLPFDRFDRQPPV